MFFVVLILLVLFDFWFLYWSNKRLKTLPYAAWWRTLSAVLVGAQLLGLGLMFLPSDTKAILPPSFWRPFSTWLYVWHLLVVPVTVVILLPVQVSRGVVGGVRGLMGSRAGGLSESASVDAATGVSSLEPASGSDRAMIESLNRPLLTSRRRFLGAAAVMAPHMGLAAGLLESDRQGGLFRIREMSLSIPRLPRRLEGMVIAHVSDTHVGRFVRERELERIMQATADIKPDLVAFTGDLIDYNIADLDMSISALKQLGRMVKAPVALCVGNHDLFDKAEVFRSRMRIEGLGLMLNETMPVEVRGERFNVMGLDWGLPEAVRADGMKEHMKRLVKKHWSGGFGVLLAHHPHAFDLAAEAGIPLTLAGHTHGGQLMLSERIGLGPLAYRYWSGAYEKGDQRLVVSNGTGNWFPIRIGAPAEIAKITLRGA